MKYTEEEAKALLKVMGFEMRSVPEWGHSPESFFRYAAYRHGNPGFRLSGDTYNELLDCYFLEEKQRELADKAIKYMETNHEQ